MKLFAIIVLCSGLAYGDQSGIAFAEGFARALERSLAQQQGQPVQQQPASYERQQGRWDIRDNYGSLSGYNFGSLSQCESFVGFNSRYKQCVWVE